MFGRKYYINPETLRYERVTLSVKQRVRYSILIGLGVVALAVLLRFGFERYYPTPRQIIYQRENSALRSDYVALNSRLQVLEMQLEELKNRDDHLYRSILSLEPVPQSIWEAGTGGSEPYAMLRNLSEPQFVLETFNRIDKLANRVQIQSNSLENVYEKAVINQDFLASKPSIHPISPGDPCWLTSTYGYRIDPFTGKRSLHLGIDIAGPYGLEVHATGNGKVISAGYSMYGYGKEVLIDHGYGYVTRYAHLQEIMVRRGQELKRGEVLGTLGSTGRSTGPHLHYEVHRDGRTVNPMYFFYENLTSDEYNLLASRAGRQDDTFQSNALSQK
jgi:murein DD-endopeptidase MepM/ murein hydrolase activator NlpD